MAVKYTKVVSLQTFVEGNNDYTRGKIYEINSAKAKEFIKRDCMILCDNSMWDNSKLPEVIYTKVIRVD